jgi:histidinol dehydrogenase
MATPKIRRISFAEPNAPAQLAALRADFTNQAEIVSPRGRELTQRVFGEPMAPWRVVERICRDVQSRGLQAVAEYTEKLDRVTLNAENLRVSSKELEQAFQSADPAFIDLIRRVRQNILSFQLGLLHSDAVMTVPGSHELRLRYRPIRRVGICIPGGAASYPSTLLMTVCPAQAAGVKELAIVMPPGPFGAGNPELLAVCRELGVTEVYRVGGAQAVAALAYGVDGLPPVDMIVGPGNLFVMLAKKFVYGQVAIDMLAGPSEIVVLADESSNAHYVAADLLAQAEHSPGVSILITWHSPLLEDVSRAIEQQLAGLDRADLARASLEQFGALVLVRDAAQAVACANQIAPEHLHIATANPEALASLVENAGAIFLGQFSPVALGDYVAGPSHVLPTGGTARFASGLSANDFLRRSSVVSFTREGLAQAADDLRTLALRESLSAHAASVDIRLSDNARQENPAKATKLSALSREPPSRAAGIGG